MFERALTGCLAMTAIALTACVGNGNFSERTNADGSPYTSSGGGADGTNGAGGTNAASCVTTTLPVTPLQRLTQQQFANTASTLLHLPAGSVAATSLPQDEAVGPFAINTQAAVTDLVADQYQSAAVSYASLAMGNLNAILPCKPSALSAACTQQFIAQFGQRAFRRPLTTDEVARYTTLSTGRAANDPNTIRLIVQAFLQSPYFLYRPEFGDPNTASGGMVDLTPYERATRLAFFLWNTGPDDSLLEAASNGSLKDAAGMASQVDTMIGDARYPASVGTYVSSLLGIATFAGIQKDPNTYPQYTPALQAALLQETQDFVGYVLSQDATLTTLLTSSSTVASSPLLSYYGLTAPAGQGAGSVVSLAGVQRGGILTRGAFLAIHGHSNASAPVPRGRIVRENLLCQVMPAPPPGVNAVPPAPKPGSTTRQLLLAHESNASCAACHVLMDHIGFGFEHFDGAGSWRDTDSGSAIDVTGDIAGTSSSNAAFDGATDLSTKLAASADVSHCVVTQMYRYGMARSETAADACLINGLNQAFVASKGDLRLLMRNVAQSQAFTRLRVGP